MRVATYTHWHQRQVGRLSADGHQITPLAIDGIGSLQSRFVLEGA